MHLPTKRWYKYFTQPVTTCYAVEFERLISRKRYADDRLSIITLGLNFYKEHK
jgi:hypothetical protein